MYIMKSANTIRIRSTREHLVTAAAATAAGALAVILTVQPSARADAPGSEHAHMSLTPKQEAIDAHLQAATNLLDEQVFQPGGVKAATQPKREYPTTKLKPGQSSTFFTQGAWDTKPGTKEADAKQATSFFIAETLTSIGHKATETITIKRQADGTFDFKDIYTKDGTKTVHQAAVAPITDAETTSDETALLHDANTVIARAEDAAERFLNHQPADLQPNATWRQ